MNLLEFNKKWFKDGKFIKSSSHFDTYTDAIEFIINNATSVEYSNTRNSAYEKTLDVIKNDIKDAVDYELGSQRFVVQNIARDLADYTNVVTRNKYGIIKRVVEQNITGLVNAISYKSSSTSKVYFHKVIYKLANATVVVKGVNRGGHIDLVLASEGGILQHIAPHINTWLNNGSVRIGIDADLYIDGHYETTESYNYSTNLHIFSKNSLTKYIDYALRNNRRELSPYEHNLVHTKMFALTKFSWITESMFIETPDREGISSFLRSTKFLNFLVRKVRSWGISWRGVDLAKVFADVMIPRLNNLAKQVENPNV